MAVIKTRWSAPKESSKKEEVKPVVAPKVPKYKKVVKKEVAHESTPVVEEEMTIDDVLATLEKKSQ